MEWPAAVSRGGNAKGSRETRENQPREIGGGVKERGFVGREAASGWAARGDALRRKRGGRGLTGSDARGGKDLKEVARLAAIEMIQQGAAMLSAYVSPDCILVRPRFLRVMFSCQHTARLRRGKRELKNQVKTVGARIVPCPLIMPPRRGNSFAWVTLLSIAESDAHDNARRVATGVEESGACRDSPSPPLSP